LLRRHRPTIFPIVPAICEAISNELEREEAEEKPTNGHANGNGNGSVNGNGAVHKKTARIEGLRLCISGAAPPTQAIAERFERLTGARLIEGYGLSEASPVTHANLTTEPHYGSIGLPLSDTRCRLVDVDDPTRDVPVGEPGELIISGPQVMHGYFANPHDTTQTLIK